MGGGRLTLKGLIRKKKHDNTGESESTTNVSTNNIKLDQRTILPIIITYQKAPFTSPILIQESLDKAGSTKISTLRTNIDDVFLTKVKA